MGEKGGSILATTNNEIIEVLKTIAPGTPIREGLENILKAKTGGLIVIGDGKEVMDIADGGFRLDVEYTPARLYELAKMDGAIIISSDLKRILYLCKYCYNILLCYHLLIFLQPILSMQ